MKYPHASKLTYSSDTSITLRFQPDPTDCREIRSRVAGRQLQHKQDVWLMIVTISRWYNINKKITTHVLSTVLFICWGFRWKDLSRLINLQPSIVHMFLSSVLQEPILPVRSRKKNRTDKEKTFVKTMTKIVISDAHKMQYTPKICQLTTNMALNTTNKWRSVNKNCKMYALASVLQTRMQLVD